MTGFVQRHSDLGAVSLGVAAGLAAAFAAAAGAVEAWAFVRRGYEAGLFAFFLC